MAREREWNFMLNVDVDAVMMGVKQDQDFCFAFCSFMCSLLTVAAACLRVLFSERMKRHTTRSHYLNLKRRGRV